MVLCVAVAACSSSDTAGSSSPSPPGTIATPTTTPLPTTPSPGVPLSPVPDLPAGVPASLDRDVPAGDVPTDALVPGGTEVTGSWYATTSSGESIVVAWDEPGPDPSDPFLPRGIAVWRRFDDGGAPWRPVYGVAYAKRAGIYAIASVIGDMTGDGSDDALVFAETGGSGACGTYDVLDLASATRVFDKQVCDTQITPSANPAGLTIIEAIYAHDDPHCCPSATRTTVMTYAADGAWHVASREVIPTG
jgi:hypothetical protein